jgi:hypothetical protein
MPWNDLASNQMVSYTDAQTSPFILKPGQSSVTSNQCMTRLDIVTKYNVQSGLPDNQLVPKSAWVASNSVVFTPPAINNNSGTVSILGNPATFVAVLSVSQYSGGTFTFSLTINGITRSVSATSTGSFESAPMTISQGTYSFNVVTTTGFSPSGSGTFVRVTQ